MTDTSSGSKDLGGPLILEVEPDTSEWGSRNDKWQADLFTLRQRLEQRVPAAVVPAVAKDGHMGVEYTEVALALGSSGVFTAAVEVFRVWLQEKNKTRKLVARWKIGDESGEVTLDGDNIDSNDLTAIVQEKIAAG